MGTREDKNCFGGTEARIKKRFFTEAHKHVAEIGEKIIHPFNYSFFTSQICFLLISFCVLSISLMVHEHDNVFQICLTKFSKRKLFVRKLLLMSLLFYYSNI